jgi:hypothetical protein
MLKCLLLNMESVLKYVLRTLAGDIWKWSLHVILWSKMTPRYFTLFARRMFHVFSCSTSSETLLSLLEKQIAWVFPSLIFMFQCSHHNFAAVSLRCSLQRTQVKITLRLTVSWPVSLGVKPHLGFKTRFCYFKQLQFCLYGVPSLTRGWVCHLSQSKSVVHVFYIYSFTCQHST